jgi:hypothetical protein
MENSNPSSILRLKFHALQNHLPCHTAHRIYRVEHVFHAFVKETDRQKISTV